MSVVIPMCTKSCPVLSCGCSGDLWWRVKSREPCGKTRSPERDGKDGEVRCKRGGRESAPQHRGGWESGAECAVPAGESVLEGRVRGDVCSKLGRQHHAAGGNGREHPRRATRVRASPTTTRAGRAVRGTPSCAALPSVSHGAAARWREGASERDKKQATNSTSKRVNDESAERSVLLFNHHVVELTLSTLLPIFFPFCHPYCPTLLSRVTREVALRKRPLWLREIVLPRGSDTPPRRPATITVPLGNATLLVLTTM